jgi:VWFA-related protein
MVRKPTKLAIAALGALVGRPVPAQAPPPVFGASVEAVHVDVFVSRGGEAVPGLTASNFELEDNDVRQSVELVSAELRPLRSFLVFDTSSSVVGERLTALRTAGNLFLDGLRPADETGLIGFSEEVGWLARPSADKAAARKALASLQPTGATAVYDALFATIALSEDAGRSVIVLFTDGEDNMSVLDAKQVMTATLRSNVLVHAVAWVDAAPPTPPSATGAQSRLPPMISSGGGPPLEPQHLFSLRKIAEATGGRFWTADSPERLRKAFAEIAEAMGHRYVLRYEPQGVGREGWHRIEVRLKRQKGEVQARKGYWVAPPRGTPAPAEP